MTGRRFRAQGSAAASLLLLACAAGLVCASFAQASFELTTPRLLSDPSPVAFPPDYAARSTGGGLAVWGQQPDSGEASIHVASISEGGRPGEAMEVDHDPEAYLLRPSIATAPDGQTALAWAAVDPVARQTTVRTAAIGPDGEPGAVHEVDTASDTAAMGAGESEVLVDSSGRLVLVWAAYRRLGFFSYRTELRWARIGADGGLLGDVNVVPLDPPSLLYGLQVAIDSADRVTAGWLHDPVGNPFGDMQIETVRFGLDGERSPIRQLTSGPHEVSGFDLVVAADGRATVAWRSLLGKERVQAVQLAASDAEPGPVLELSGPQTKASGPVAAIGPGGRITVLWERWHRLTVHSRLMKGLAVQVVSQQIKPGGALGPVRPLSERRSRGSKPAIVSTAAGRLFAAWQREGGPDTRRKIQLARLDRAGRVARSAAAGPGGGPALAISGGGRPVVSWRTADPEPANRPIAVSTLR